MERWVAKLLALAGTFVLPFLCTIIPYRVSGYVSKRGDQGKRILGYLMCFGGGIFFGTYLLHMGPEVRRLLDEALLKPKHIDYPLSDLFTGVGFFLVLFSEKLVMLWNNSRQEWKEKLRQQRSARFKTGTVVSVKTVSCTVETNGSAVPKTDHLENGHTPDHPQPCLENGFSDLDAEHQHNSMQQQQQQQLQQQQSEEIHRQHVHHSARSIILVLALSLHRIFEGMTVGLQNSLHNIWSLFIAVMCHETVIAFSLGLQFVKSGFPFRRMLITSSVCSAVMPVGVAIGIAMTELGRTDNSVAIANGILQAFAMGTFIYVTFFEILQEEIDPHDASIGKVFFIFAGFVMMALLDLIPEETQTTFQQNVSIDRNLSMSFNSSVSS